MPRKRTTPKRDKPGRPPRVFTEAQKRKIDKMALAQCKDTTIARVLDIPLETFRERFRERTEKKRAEGKSKVLQAQYRAASSPKGSTVDRIWWGKQHLDQSDKQEMTADMKVAMNVQVVSYADAKAEGFDERGKPVES